MAFFRQITTSIYLTTMWSNSRKGFYMDRVEWTTPKKGTSAVTLNSYACKINEILPMLLERENITMVQLSKESGINYARLVSWKHKNSPKVGPELAICAIYFKVNLEFLLYGVDKLPLAEES